MKPRYIDHARDQMAERRISEAEVEAVLAAPEIEYHGHSGRMVYVSRVGLRRIKVVVKEGPSGRRVITVGD